MAAMPFKHNVRPTLQVSCNPRTRLDICGAVALGVAEPSLDLHNAHNIRRRRGTGLCLARDIDLQLGRRAGGKHGGGGAGGVRTRLRGEPGRGARAAWRRRAAAVGASAVATTHLSQSHESPECSARHTVR